MRSSSFRNCLYKGLYITYVYQRGIGPVIYPIRHQLWTPATRPLIKAIGRRKLIVEVKPPVPRCCPLMWASEKGTRSGTIVPWSASGWERLPMYTFWMSWGIPRAWGSFCGSFKPVCHTRCNTAFCAEIFGISCKSWNGLSLLMGIFSHLFIF